MSDTPMPDRLWPQIGAGGGLAYFVLAFFGNAIATSGSSADESSSGPEILRDLQAHHGAALHLGTVMELLALLALLAFVAHLASVLRRVTPHPLCNSRIAAATRSRPTAAAFRPSR